VGRLRPTSTTGTLRGHHSNLRPVLPTVLALGVGRSLPPDPAAVSTAYVNRLVDSWRDGIAPATVSVYWRNLRPFFSWWAKETGQPQHSATSSGPRAGQKATSCTWPGGRQQRWRTATAPRPRHSGPGRPIDGSGWETSCEHVGAPTLCGDNRRNRSPDAGTCRPRIARIARLLRPGWPYHRRAGLVVGGREYIDRPCTSVTAYSFRGVVAPGLIRGSTSGVAVRKAAPASTERADARGISQAPHRRATHPAGPHRHPQALVTRRPHANAVRAQAGPLDRIRRGIIAEQGDIAEPELTRRAKARRREHMVRIAFNRSRARQGGDRAQAS
jgi:hypothetical protein